MILEYMAWTLLAAVFNGKKRLIFVHIRHYISLLRWSQKCFCLFSTLDSQETHEGNCQKSTMFSPLEKADEYRERKKTDEGCVFLTLGTFFGKLPASYIPFRHFRHTTLGKNYKKCLLNHLGQFFNSKKKFGSKFYSLKYFSIFTLFEINFV